MSTELDIPYALDSTAVESFREQGFVHLSGVLSAETIAAHEPEITSKVIELNTMHLPMEQRSTYNKAFLQVCNLWEHSEAARRLAFSTRLAQIAAQLLEVDRVRLYHDQALYKEPGGGITPWHADQYYWPLASDRVCTVWIPLQETPAEMGPLGFAVGSHQMRTGRDLAISDLSEQQISQAVQQRQLPVVDEPFALGDVSYHLGWTFHHAGPNQSDTPRRVMTVIYMDADMLVKDPVPDNSRTDLGLWLPGISAGQPAASALNPIL